MIIISSMIPKPMDLKPSFPGLLFYFDSPSSVKGHNELKCINIYWIEHEIESQGLGHHRGLDPDKAGGPGAPGLLAPLLPALT